MTKQQQSHQGPLKWRSGNPLPVQETQESRVQSLVSEDTLEEEMATCSSTLAWKTPWTEEPGGLPSMGSQKSWKQHSHIKRAPPLGPKQNYPPKVQPSDTFTQKGLLRALISEWGQRHKCSAPDVLPKALLGQSVSHTQLFAVPQTVAHQVPLF